MKNLVSVIALIAGSQAAADTKRDLDAHVHGVGNLDIAVDGNTVVMAFHAPGADIVGFEYAAKTEEDRAAVDAAVAELARPLDLFVLPARAACSVVQASAMLESEAENDHDHDHDNAEHKEHDHDGHDHAAHDDHGESDSTHTEFHAEYTLNCAAPEALDTIEFAYFDTFENARELEVQIVTANGAQAFEVLRAEPTLDLRNLF